MSTNKFLTTGGNNSDLSNGSTTIFAATLAADNLNSSMPIKTNSLKELISTKLEVSDINTLQSQLDSTISTPYIGTIEATDFKSSNITSVDTDITTLKADVITLQAKTTAQTYTGGYTEFNGPITAHNIFDETKTSYIVLARNHTSIVADTFFTKDHKPNTPDIYDIGAENSKFKDVYCSSILSHSGNTGLLTGGILTSIVNGTTFNISAGTGIINSTTNNIHRPIEWSAFTSEALSVGILTHIAIDENGGIVKKAGEFSPEERRRYILIGTISHGNGTNIDYQTQNAFSLQTTNATVNDLSLALGRFNITGNVFSYNTGLTLSKTVGTSFSIGSNISSADNPNIDTNASFAGGTLSMFTASNGVIQSVGTNIEPNNYEPNGAGSLVALTSPNPWQILRLYIAGSPSQVGVAYGQNAYSSSDAAKTAITTESYVSTTSGDELLRGYLIVKRLTTNLNSADAIFVEAERFGSASSSGVGSGGGNVSSGTSTTNAIATYADANGTLIEDSVVSISATGLISDVLDPVADQDAATKKYVDTNAVPITGGTMTGGLVTTSITFPKPNGELYMESNNSTITVISAQNTWTKILGNTLSDYNEKFTHTNNRLTYTGMMPRIFHTGCTFSLTPAAATDTEWIVGIHKNNTHVVGSSVRIHSIKNDQHYSSAIHKFVTLETGDYLEVFIQNITGTMNCTISELNLFGMALPNEAPADPIVTPHNLTSNISNSSWLVEESSFFTSEPTDGGWRCFDGSLNNTPWYSAGSRYDNGSFGTGVVMFEGTAGDYVKITLNVIKSITQFAMTVGYGSGKPTQWILYGSSDNITYTPISTQSSDFDWTGLNLGDYFTPITFTSTNVKYLVFQVTKVLTNTYCNIGQLDFN